MARAKSNKCSHCGKRMGIPCHGENNRCIYLTKIKPIRDKSSKRESR